MHAGGATAADEPGHVLGCAPPSTERIKVDQVSHPRHGRGARANIFQGLDKNNIIGQGSSKKNVLFLGILPKLVGPPPPPSSVHLGMKM